MNQPKESAVHPVDSPLSGKYPAVCMFPGFPEAVADYERTKNMRATEPGTRPSDLPGFTPNGTINRFRKEQILETLSEVLVNGLGDMYRHQVPSAFINALNEAASILGMKPEDLALLVDAAREQAPVSAEVSQSTHERVGQLGVLTSQSLVGRGTASGRGGH